MEKKIYTMPTKEEIIAYYKRNGYPYPDEIDIKDFQMTEKTDELYYQFWECIAEDYELCDFDRYIHFERRCNIEIPYIDFLKIMNVLWENDIEILEL